MDLRTVRRACMLATLVAGAWALQAEAALAQAQTVDQGLQAQNASGSGTDLLKIAWFVVTRVFLPVGGIVIAAYGIMKGARRGEWFDAFVTVAGGITLSLLPALIGYVMNVNLYQLFAWVAQAGAMAVA